MHHINHICFLWTGQQLLTWLRCPYVEGCDRLKCALSVDQCSYCWRTEQLYYYTTTLMCGVLPVERAHLVGLCNVWCPVMMGSLMWKYNSKSSKASVPTAQSSDPSAWFRPSAPGLLQLCWFPRTKKKLSDFLISSNSSASFLNVAVFSNPPAPKKNPMFWETAL